MVRRGIIIFMALGFTPSFISHEVISSETMGLDPSFNSFPVSRVRFSALAIGPKSLRLTITRNNIIRASMG